MESPSICHIPAGTYTIGNDVLPESRPRHDVVLNAFAIGRTAVSNEQFGTFIAAGGYQTSSLWSEMGWRWQKHKQTTQPAFWPDSHFNHPLQPVVGVCWYEADAFANWLAQETDQPWRLPTEAEWEVAAQGDVPPQQINSVEHRIGRPWSVFGNGQESACGAVDMRGNIWEWTHSRWGRNWQALDYPYPYQTTDGREESGGSHARIMRGGSWFDTRDKAHPTHRGRYLPGSRGSNIGFRLAFDN